MIGKDFYIVNIAQPLNEDYQYVISAFYMPLIGKKAFSLYLLLTAEGKKMQMNEIDRLCILTDLDIDKLEETFIILEKYNLLLSWKKDNTYIFQINNPLSVQQFLNNDIYSRLYLQRVGRKQYELSQEKYLNKQINFDGYENISHKFDLSILDNWNENDEKTYRESKKETTDYNIEINFDYEQFIKLCNKSTVVFDHKYRTEKNMQTIGQLATLFCISPQRMFVLVGKSIDDKNECLDCDKLHQLCLKEKTVQTGNYENEYVMPPVEYLYHRQNVAVCAADKKLLEYLQVDLKMKPEVVNVLIKNVLEEKNQRLDKNYVEKVATNWIRQGIDSLEKALNQEKIEKKHVTNKTVKYDEKDMETDKVDIDQLRKGLFKDS